MNTLTTENYSKGFLIDEELMCGITQHPEKPELFVAFVLQHTTGEYLGYQPFTDLNSALASLNQIQRPWTYETFGGCGGNCGGDSAPKGSAEKESAARLTRDSLKASVNTQKLRCQCSGYFETSPYGESPFFAGQKLRAVQVSFQ